MKKIIAISVLALLGFTGAYKANAQLHNMGLQMSMIWPKGNDYGKSFNSLYGGLFYEYRFQGKDEDVNELMDHFGLEFGINYTEFIFKNNWDKSFGETSSNLDYISFFGTNKPFTKHSNKGVNFYAAPKVYVTIYPELVEMYLMGKVGYQYLNSSGSITPNNGAAPWAAVGGTNNKLFVGAAVGFEVKLGTVSVGTNLGFDNNSPSSIMKNEVYKQSGVNTPLEIYPFKKMDKMWGNLVLEFKVKAQLNGKD
jgi:hypothetical protein